MLSKEEMKNIIGGATISGAVISALKGYLGVFKEIGQAFGSAIRRFTAHNLCQIKQYGIKVK